MSFDFFPNEQQAALLHAASNPSTAPDPGTFTNFLPGAASYGMRSLAEVGRAVSMAGSVFPIAADAITEGDNFSGKSLTDRYFEMHDAVFNRAVDHWTPKPGEVGTAGQIVGQLAGGALQAAISPALLVGTSQLSTSEDLVRQGVDAGAANVVGDITGIGSAVGLKAPFLGKTLASRVLSGAVGNTLQGAATAAASHAVLKAAGSNEAAGQFDPWDVKARLLDTMLGAAFGGLEHLGARSEEQATRPPKLSPTDEAALLVANQARHMEQTTAPGRPLTEADLTQHVQAMREAIGQTLRGEPVAVDRTILGMNMVPDAQAAQARAEVGAEVARLAGEEAPPVPPLEVPRGQDGSASPGATTGTPPADMTAQQDMTTARAHAAIAQNPDLMIPTGHVDEQGGQVHLRAADAMAAADSQVTQAKASADNLFRTAAACLMGAL